MKRSDCPSTGMNSTAFLVRWWEGLFSPTIGRPHARRGPFQEGDFSGTIITEICPSLFQVWTTSAGQGLNWITWSIVEPNITRSNMFRLRTAITTASDCSSVAC